MHDADAIIAEHALDTPLLLEAGRLISREAWHASAAGRHEHAALFALVASAHRQRR